MLKFLDIYTNLAQLVGEAFVIDSVQIHILLVNFISGNN